LAKNFVWNKGGRLFVSNHPSWLDQVTTLALKLLHWSSEFLPFVAVASDSIKRLPILKVLQNVAFLIPIERNGDKNLSLIHIRKMMKILNSSHNLMMAGAMGRDFKATEDEWVFSPQKRKPMRKFTELCGLLAIQRGVETIPWCIDGTQKFYKEVIIDGKKEMKFSFRSFFVEFWLRGKFDIVILYGEPLILQGKSRFEATKIIQDTTLHLLDLAGG